MQDEINNNIVKDVLMLERRTPDTAENHTMLKEVADYIKGMSYLKQKTSIERLQSYIEGDFDYKATLAILKDKGIETSYSAIRESICYVNKVLKQKLGEDIVYELKANDGNVFGKMLLLNMDTSKLLLPDVVKVIPEFQYARFDIKDCMYELLFLAKYSSAIFNQFHKHMDSKKLAYLYHVLTDCSSNDTQLAFDMAMYLKKARKATKAEFKEYWTDRGYEIDI